MIKICRGLNITIQNLQDVLDNDDTDDKIILSSHEEKLICQYRQKKDLQKAIDILLFSDT